MIKEFIPQWNANKKKLKKYFESTPQSEYDEYEKIVKLVCKIILKDKYGFSGDYETVNDTDIWEINNGCHHGSIIFVLTPHQVEPKPTDYIWTYVYYGSCSECDALLRISDYEDGLPNEQQVKDYMTLALHLFQRLQHFKVEEEYRQILD